RADALPAGFSRLEGPERLHSLLGESEFVAVCCQWTPETTGLIGRAAFEAMRRGTVLVNVARGEIVDESALIEALASGQLRCGGAAAGAAAWLSTRRVASPPPSPASGGTSAC